MKKMRNNNTPVIPNEVRNDKKIKNAPGQTGKVRFKQTQKKRQLVSG